MHSLMTNIYITDKCKPNEFKCKHCYYPTSGRTLTKDVANQVVDWIVKQCQDEQVQYYKAHLLGGEPFQEPDVLFYLIDTLKTALPPHTKPHPDGQFVVFTNGEYLDRDALSECKARHVYVMLNPTDKDLHTVHELMHLIKSVCGGVSLAIVADEVNLSRLPQLTELAIAHNAHIRINRLYHGGTIPGYVEEFAAQMHRVFDRLLAAERPMWPNFILESTYPTWQDDRIAHACGRWLVVIDPDGTIRSCNADMSTVCGHISTNISIRDLHFTHRWSARNLAECQGCEWAKGGWCNGGCPFTRKLTWGTYNKATPFCEAYKTLFPRLRELTEKWLKYNAVER